MQPDEGQNGWYCPLLKRWIEAGHCLDINYQRLGLFEEDVLESAKRETGLRVQEISVVCEACPNQPLRGRARSGPLDA